MRISTGQQEDHPSVMAVDTAATPAVAPPTQMFPSGNEQGGVRDLAGERLSQLAASEAECAAAQSYGMGADTDRRGRYEAAASPLGASAGDAMRLPPGGMDPGAGSGEALPAGSFYTPPRSGAPADTG